MISSDTIFFLAQGEGEIFTASNYVAAGSIIRMVCVMFPPRRDLKDYLG